MREINTTLVHADSGEAVTIKTNTAKGLNDLFGAGFILHSKKPQTNQFATDATGLQIVKEQLEYTQSECLWGLSGIGALLLAADPVNLCRNDIENVGTLVKNLAELTQTVKDHLDTVNHDIERRANLITDSKQAAHHANLHQAAVELRRTRSMSYADAVAMVANSFPAGMANAETSEEA